MNKKLIITAMLALVTVVGFAQQVMLEDSISKNRRSSILPWMTTL